MKILTPMNAEHDAEIQAAFDGEPEPRCLWCDTPKSQWPKDRACPAPDGDGHVQGPSPLTRPAGLKAAEIENECTHAFIEIAGKSVCHYCGAEES